MQQPRHQGPRAFVFPEAGIQGATSPRHSNRRPEITKSRRAALTLCLIAIVASIFAVPATIAVQEPQPRPDIIVVMVDDLGAMDERILERLPNIRSLFLRPGLRFDNAYSETPLCCPGRASFLTGQHTRNHGVVSNDVGLLNPRNTIVTALDGVGYHTVFAGKYLNGASQMADHTPPGWDRVAMLTKWDTNVSSEWRIDNSLVTGGFFDRVLAEQAVGMLASAPSDQPLFMWLTPHGPHKSDSTDLPWKPDIEPAYVGDGQCAGIKRYKPPSYSLPEQPDGFPLDDVCRSLLTVDDMVGDLRFEIERQGRNPYWVFMSDNGMAWGAGGYALKNVPQAGRLPLYFTGPGIDRGDTNALVSNIDIAPTLAELAGTDMPRADGRSFVDLLRGGEGPRRLMLEDHPLGGPYGGKELTGPWWGVRTRQWHLVVWNGVHLYDVREDRWEQHDLADEHPDIVMELASAVRRAGQLAPPPTPTPVPTPDPTPSPPPTDQPPKPTDAPSPAPTEPPAQATDEPAKPEPTVASSDGTQSDTKPPRAEPTDGPRPRRTKPPAAAERPADDMPERKKGGADSLTYAALGASLFAGLAVLLYIPMRRSRRFR
jgi:arylsulfatase A-like enzyme